MDPNVSNVFKAPTGMYRVIEKDTQKRCEKIIDDYHTISEATDVVRENTPQGYERAIYNDHEFVLSYTPGAVH